MRSRFCCSKNFLFFISNQKMTKELNISSKTSKVGWDKKMGKTLITVLTSDPIKIIVYIFFWWIIPCGFYFVGLVAFWMMPFWMILSDNYATLAMKGSYVCRWEVLEVVVRGKKRKLLTGKQMRKVPEASHSFPGKISSDQESLKKQKLLS